jgi:uracil-DNA glycosylase family 4
MDPFFADEMRKTLSLPKGAKQLIAGRGSPTPKVLIIGEAAGPQENEVGLPFVGRSGQLLDQWIHKWDLSAGDYAITNIVKWFPNDEGKIRAPKQDEIDLCRPLLAQQIRALNPKLIVALGAIAKNELTDNTDGQLEASGKDHPLRALYGLSIPVLVLPHPSFYLRNGRSEDHYTKMAFQVIHQVLGREKLLIIDIETDASVDVENAKVRFLGAYSFPDKELTITRDKAEMQSLIDRHTHLIGYNNREFDLPILKNNGIDSIGKVVVDLYQGMKARGRKEVMKLDKLEREGLDDVVAHLGLGTKMDFDYQLLKKTPPYSDEEMKLITDYLRNDIQITKKLFLWWEEWAKPFEAYIGAKNRWKRAHMTCSVASYAYKAICHATGRPEEYLGEDAPAAEGTFEGGFVSADMEEARGKILLLDFASLYPHNFFQGNLFSPAPKDYTGPVFKANEFYPNLLGTYRVDALGDVETTLKGFYNLRRQYKKAKDPREYALKIVLNSSYGAGTCSNFRSIYNPTIGPDTTYIGRQNIKYMRKLFADEGIKIVYTDTDSIYLLLPDNKTPEDIERIRKAGVEEIKKWLPFPAETFSFDIQEKIKYFQCFRHLETGNLLKKFYLYVTEEGKIVTKGLPIVKSNCTRLAKKVFERLAPEIIEKKECHFPKRKIDLLIREEFATDPSIVAKCFKVREAKFYKSPSQLDCQIARRYGAGKYWLIKNRVVGIGIGVKFCTIEDAKRLTYDQLDLSTTYEELGYFIKKETLDDFGG